MMGRVLRVRALALLALAGENPQTFSDSQQRVVETGAASGLSQRLHLPWITGGSSSKVQMRTADSVSYTHLTLPTIA